MRLDLEPTPLSVLHFLVANRQRVIGKQELRTAVWHDINVADNTIDRAVSRVRRMLGDDADQPQFVETVERRGWRFIARVRVTSPDGQRSRKNRPHL